MRAVRGLLLGVVVGLLSMVGCKDDGTTQPSASGHDTKPTGARDDKMTWERAEEIARQHVAAQGWRDRGHDRYQPNPRVKYLFKYLHLSVLVHRGEVLPENQGVAALARYLWELGAEDRQGLTATDMGQLIGYFDAYPPVQKRSPWAYYDGSADHPWGSDHPAVLPHIEWSMERASFRIYFDDSSDGGENVSDELPRILAEWTLTLSSDGKGAWSERQRRYSLPRKQFVE
jgi:hypothetical protein